MLKLIHRFFPYILIYTDDERMGETFDAFNFGILIIIQEREKENIGLLKHELKHVEQFYRTLGLGGILYRVSARYRFYCEVEAYVEQIKYSGYTKLYQLNPIVDLLYKGYNLDRLKLTEADIQATLINFDEEIAKVKWL